MTSEEEYDRILSDQGAGWRKWLGMDKKPASEPPKPPAEGAKPYLSDAVRCALEHGSS